MVYDIYIYINQYIYTYYPAKEYRRLWIIDTIYKYICTNHPYECTVHIYDHAHTKKRPLGRQIEVNKTFWLLFRNSKSQCLSLGSVRYSRRRVPSKISRFVAKKETKKIHGCILLCPAGPQPSRRKAPATAAVPQPQCPGSDCPNQRWLLQWLLPPLADLLFPFVAQQQLWPRTHRPAGFPIPDPVAFGVDQSEGPDLCIGEAPTPPVS